MENYFLSNIKENDKYIDGLKKIAEDIEPMTIEEYNQQYKKICSNNSLSELSKTFYLSRLKHIYFTINIFIPYLRTTLYILRNRMTDFLEDFFTFDYNIIPITFPELYELLIQLPQNERKNILQQMNLSMKTISGVVTAIKNKSKSDFILYMESETNNLYDVCKALNVYKILYSCYSFFEKGKVTTDDEDETDTLIKEFNEFVKEFQANNGESVESIINKHEHLKKFYQERIANGSFKDRYKRHKNNSVLEELSTIAETTDLFPIIIVDEDLSIINKSIDYFINLLKPLFIIEEIPFFLNETEIKDELLEKKFARIIVYILLKKYIHYIIHIST